MTKTFYACIITTLSLFAQEPALGQATLSGNFRNMRLNMSSGRPADMVPLTIDPSSNATIGIFRHEAKGGFVDIDRYGEITSLGAGIFAGSKEQPWPVARVSFFEATQGDTAIVYTEAGLAATCKRIYYDGIVTGRIDVTMTDGKTNYYSVAAPRAGSFDEMQTRDSKEPLTFIDSDFGDGSVESKELGKLKVLIVASVESGHLILVTDKTGSAATVTGVPRLEVRTSGNLPFLTRIGPVGRDERGEMQYGTVYEDHEYDYPCEVLVGGQAQEGRLGVRGGQIVVRYSEDVIDLSAESDARFVGFRTKSNWRAVESTGPGDANLWRIRAEEGSYLEATITSNGEIGRLHVSEGARGLIPGTPEANPISIAGKTYDLQGSGLVLEFGQQGVTVSRFSGRHANTRIALGALFAVAATVAVTLALRRRRRLTTR